MSARHIKAPYNFVPLSDKPVYPYWSDFISHDIPFEDALSGTLEVRMKAHSPIFVRNGTPKNSQETKEVNFSQHDDQYFIPGSSIRGMVRNVLEIMTFSKIGNSIADDRYAFRDLSRAAEKTYRDKFNVDSTFGGWLYKKGNGEYALIDCGKPGRISLQNIDAYFGTDLSTFFGENGKFDPSQDKEKSAKFKYDQIKLSGKDLQQPFLIEGEDKYGREMCIVASEEELPGENRENGTLVLTGQPDKRKYNTKKEKWEGKFYEFVFFDSESEVTVPDSVVRDFFFAYYDHDRNRASDDWKIWAEKLENNEKIPVFFHKNGNEASAIGLSYLFKLPYPYSVADAIPSAHKEARVDFAEGLFGFIKEKNEHDSLKGRLHFSHAFALAGTAKPSKLEKVVLSSPKASYYPTYIRQTTNGSGKLKGQYKTFMNEDAQIAGWKRYPTHQESSTTDNPRPQNSSDDVTVAFVPLEAGAEFEFKVHYHNLKAIELGALLSAITFHLTPATFHCLGMAKPLGYGKVRLQVKDENLDTSHLRAFESYMEAAGIKNWHRSEAIRELLTMASEQLNKEASKLAYMTLETKGTNAFTKAKGEKEALDLYSKLSAVQAKTAPRLATPESIERAKKEERHFQRMKLKLEGHMQHIEKAQKEFDEQLNAVKKEVLLKLKARQENLAKLAKEAKIAQTAKIYESGEPEWHDIDLNHRDAFKDLSKILKRYIEGLNKGQKYDKLIKERKQTALIPERLHGKLEEKLYGIYSALSSEKNQLKWKAPYKDNATLRKATEWLGDEKAAAFFQKLT